MSKRLTKREMDAIIEALENKLAGFMEKDDLPREVYESASEKMKNRRDPETSHE